MTHPGVYADIAALRQFVAAIEVGPERTWRSGSGDLVTRLAPEGPRAIGTSEHHLGLAAIGEAQRSNVAAYADRLHKVADALATLRGHMIQQHNRYRDADDTHGHTANDLQSALDEAARDATGGIERG